MLLRFLLHVLVPAVRNALLIFTCSFTRCGSALFYLDLLTPRRYWLVLLWTPHLTCLSGPVRSSPPLASRHGRGSAVPRVVHFCTSLGTPRRSVRKRRSEPLFRLGFPRSCTRLLWIVVLPLRPPGRAPAKTLSSVISTRSSAAVPAACVWLRASWSVGTSRHRHA